MSATYDKATSQTDIQPWWERSDYMFDEEAEARHGPEVEANTPFLKEPAPHNEGGLWHWLHFFNFGCGFIRQHNTTETDECNGCVPFDEFKLRKDQMKTPDDQTDSGNFEPKLHYECSTDLFMGWVEKRSPTWVEGWRPRVFVLMGGKFLYFNPERPDRPVGVLDFNLVQFELVCSWEDKELARTAHKASRGCVCQCTNDTTDGIYLRPREFSSKVFAFRAMKGTNIRDVASALKKLIANAEVSPFQDEVLSQHNFWRFPFIREADWLKQAQPGDILLFQGKDRGSQTIRGLTSSQYDHVGILLRSNAGSLLLLEATGLNGVAALPWSIFKLHGWHKLYSRLACRKVYFQRSQAQMTALQTYVLSVLGSRYQLSARKLVRCLSESFDEDGKEIPNDKEIQKDAPVTDEDHRTFFCSELVAACLKRCGVLAGERSSSRYFPSSFSQNSIRGIPLQDHVRIGEEQVILFD